MKVQDVKREWYAKRDGNKWINFGFVAETGLYHWEKDSSYAGYTVEELIEMGCE